MPRDVEKFEVVICKGLPASGKSTWAKQQAFKPHVKRVNKDDLRAMLDDSKHNKSNEKFVCLIRDNIISESLKANKSVIVDDTNLQGSHVERIKELVDDENQGRRNKNKIVTDYSEIKIRIEFFDVDVMECIRRNSQRSGNARVPHAAILRMYNDYLRLPDQPKLTVNDIPDGLIYDRDLFMTRDQDESLERSIICDLDGTLSIMVDRSPHATEGCIKDKLNEPVANILKTYKEKGYKIILFSGRRGEQLKETRIWLDEHDIEYDFLRMRAVGDMRADNVIKREFFEESVDGKYFVEFILDDRNQVVDLWRKDLGLPCLQVYYGNF